MAPRGRVPRAIREIHLFGYTIASDLETWRCCSLGPTRAAAAAAAASAVTAAQPAAVAGRTQPDAER